MDVTDKVIIVTGGNSGIGFAAAQQLAQDGAQVVIASRNETRGQEAVTNIKNAVGASAKVTFLPLDLSKLSTVRNFVDKFKAQFDRLDILILNAGIMMVPFSKTEDGFEIQIGTNHFGHYALCGLLFDMLRAQESARVVVVSSLAHRRGNIDFDDIFWEKREYTRMTAYSDSKLANLLFVRGLVQKLQESKIDNILVSACHPGWTATGLQHKAATTTFEILLMGFINKVVCQSTERGAIPTLHCARGNVEQGAYYGPDGFRHMWGTQAAKEEPYPQALSDESASKLWKISEEKTGISFGF
eukprot:m.36597 g.36597  ORF g.36597 m.36597 type:complete len:300 (-) comp16050_c0_seq1:106-1005(-)